MGPVGFPRNGSDSDYTMEMGMGVEIELWEWKWIPTAAFHSIIWKSVDSVQ